MTTEQQETLAAACREARNAVVACRRLADRLGELGMECSMSIIDVQREILQSVEDELRSGFLGTHRHESLPTN
jgi:hypothetical protein